jgi:hypothetical protein
MNNDTAKPASEFPAATLISKTFLRLSDALAGGLSVGFMMGILMPILWEALK